MNQIEIVLISAAVSGIVSLVANLLSLYVQFQLRDKERRKREKDTWFQDSISLTRQIRRQAREIPAAADLDPRTKLPESDEVDSVEIESLKESIDDLKSLQDNMPPELRGSKVDRNIGRFIDSFENTDKEKELTSIDLRQVVYQGTREILDSITSAYDRSSSDLY